jgi:formylglycine-generating enzyme required for sulfatase activity
MDNLEKRATARLSEQITRDYHILSLLGKGGMGEVYLAEQLRVGRRRIALKVLSRACSEDPEIVKRFENEAASSGRIHHRNVVMIFESRASDDGQLYVAMEYVDGKTLRDEISERGALPLAEVVEISKQICAGLSAAHRLGIVHRDIKPDNLMLTRDDEGRRVVKILDFGIARLAESGTVQSRTASGIIMGTPYYMSPEQALGSTGDKIDARSDIYSLGMVVYQMLTGRVAFESDSWMSVMYKHIHEPPLQPRELRPELCWYEEFEQAVLRALEKDRDKRPQTVTEFADEMESAYRRAVAANPEAVGAAAYDVTVVGVAPPFIQTTAAAVPERRQTVAPVETATPASWQAMAAARAAPPSALSQRRKALAIAGLLILVVMSAIYFLRSRPAAAPRQVAADTGPAAVAKPMPEMQTFEFDVLTLDPTGHLNVPHRSSASYFSEDIDGEVSLDMVEIPAGTFKMGAPLETQRERKRDERPQRQIRVPRFFMSKYEITEAQWRAVARLPVVGRQLEENPSSFKGDGQMPVQNIAWLDAVEFCERLSRATGRRYRLPTEAEWEYACAAGTETPFYFGETITAELVNYDANYPYGAGPKGETRRRPVPVGAMSAPNAFGLYNMHGNVAEWCSDYWHDSYIGAPADASSWQSRGDATQRVLRGGSYYDGGDDCRSAARTKDPADIRLPFIGCRVVMVAP